MDLLFAFHDPGETYALLPVLPLLETQGVKVSVLAAGASVTLVPSERLTWALPFTAGVRHWVEEAFRDNAPSIAVVGVVAETQRVIAEELKKRDVKVVGYYDSFHGLDVHGEAESFAPYLTEFWCSLAMVGEEWKTRQPQVPVSVVGQPIVEEWLQPPSSEMVTGMERWLNLREGEKHAAYIAGYGADYPEDFELFLELATMMPEVRFSVSLHPKTDARFELERLGHSKLKNVAIAPRQFSTRVVLETVEAVVAYRSSAGFLALFLGLPVFYLNHGKSLFRNHAIHLGLAPQVSSVSQLAKCLGDALCKTRHTPPQEGLFEKLGLPRNSAQLIASRLTEN